MRRDMVAPPDPHAHHVEKKWGWEEIFVNDRDADYCLKRLVVLPGNRCSWHQHQRKTETFRVVEGRLHVGLKRTGEPEERFTLYPGESLKITPGVLHCFWSHVPTSFYEVSTSDAASDSIRKDSSCEMLDDDKAPWESWPGRRRIVVIGDSMVDRYHSLSVKGVSAEVPLLVTRPKPNLLLPSEPYHADGLLPGGAAHLASIFSQLECSVSFVTSVGSDAMGSWLSTALDAMPYVMPYVVRGSRWTTVKNRYMVDRTQSLRVDEDAQVSAVTLSEIVHLINTAFLEGGMPDAIVLSDYRKGLLTVGGDAVYNCIGEFARLHDVPVYVDPYVSKKQLHESGDGPGPYLVKMNWSEATKVLGSFIVNLSSCCDVTERIMEKLGAEHVVLTRANEPACLRFRYREPGLDNPVHHVAKAVWNESVDVSGAGDVMMANLVVEGLIKGIEPGFRLAVDAATQQVQRRRITL